MEKKKEKIAKTMLDETLNEIYKHAIAHDDKNLTKSMQVFNEIFHIIRSNMAKCSKYFKRYNTEVQYASSIFDDVTKETKTNEVDLYVVMNLPVSYDDSEYGIIIENEKPGFVNLKISKGFDTLVLNPDWSSCYKETASWRDDNKYLLQTMFRKWMYLILSRVFKDNRRYSVDDITYYVKCPEFKSNSNQAFTLKINYEEAAENLYEKPKLIPFLDVCILPVIKFILPRWPSGYTQLEPRKLKDEKEWFVVAKPRDSIEEEKQRNKCWTLSFQSMELKMLMGCGSAKTVIRLIKKLHNTLGLNEINCDYIKTILLWKVNSLSDKSYWKNNLGVIFRNMLEELHEGIKNKFIPNFWYKEHNLLDGIKPYVLEKYEKNLKQVLDSLFKDDVKNVVSFLLTPEELIKFNEQQPKLCERLQYHCVNVHGADSTSDRSHLVMANLALESSASKSYKNKNNVSSKSQAPKQSKKPALSDNPTEMLDEIDLTKKADMISNKVDQINDRIQMLENNFELSTDSTPIENSKELELKTKADMMTKRVEQIFDKIKLLEQKFSEQDKMAEN